MENWNCVICGGELHVWLRHPVRGDEIAICRAHFDFIESMKRELLIQLIEMGKNGIYSGVQG
jgi:hypothetical protein